MLEMNPLLKALDPNLPDYAFTIKLHNDRPGKYILEGTWSWFHIEDYISAGHCHVIRHEVIPPQIDASWSETVPSRLVKLLKSAWLSVEWNGNIIELVTLGCYSPYDGRTCRVIADSETVADAFCEAVRTWSSQARDEVFVYTEREWIKSSELFTSIKSSTFDNIILAPSLKQELQTDFARFFASQAVYDKYGIPWKRGALFVGPPGNGKTHAVKALINSLEVPPIYVKSLGHSCNSGEREIGEVFRRAREMAPCVIILEDLDSLVGPGNRSTFLNEMDGFGENSGIVVIATTNHPERLDPAMLDRPSRFDRKYHFNLPEIAERQNFLEFWNNKLGIDVRLSQGFIDELAQSTAGFSFVYLKELWVSSLTAWVNASAEPLSSILAGNAAHLAQQMQTAKKRSDATRHRNQCYDASYGFEVSVPDE